MTAAQLQCQFVGDNNCCCYYNHIRRCFSDVHHLLAKDGGTYDTRIFL